MTAFIVAALPRRLLGCAVRPLFAQPRQCPACRWVPRRRPTRPPSTKAYRDAMAKMDQGMAITYSGDADKDFVAGMIPHHQGAIDMAQVELHYGKDPQLRKLARDIIAAQQKEIAFMKSWQAKHAQMTGRDGGADLRRSATRLS